MPQRPVSSPRPRSAPRVRRGRVLLGALLLLLAPVGAHAATCTISTTGLAFGAYDPNATVPVSGNGSVSLNCSASTLEDDFFGFTVTLSLSQGASGTYAKRVMTLGPSQLPYNLYTNPALSTIFGNGTGGTGTDTLCYPGFFGGCSGSSGTSGQTATLAVYGQIPAGADVVSGTYSDSIIATLTF